MPVSNAAPHWKCPNCGNSGEDNTGWHFINCPVLAEQQRSKRPKSPCTGICYIVEATGKCIGCGRTLLEITEFGNKRND